MTLNAKILIKNGKKQFAILPYEQFVAVQKRLAEMEELLELRKAKRMEGKKPSISLAAAKRRIELS
jgi:hypothetical protein